MLPREPYDLSGRWADYGDDMFRLKDRKGADHLLGPTHERCSRSSVKDLFSSYKDLPTSLYQIQWKFRDEQRPQGRPAARARVPHEGQLLLRRRRRRAAGRPTTGTARPTSALRPARLRVRHRRRDERRDGRLGERGVPRGQLVGEDTYVRCTTCDYAANTEAVRVPAPPAQPYDDVPAAHAEDTPDTPTIDTLVKLSNDRATCAGPTASGPPPTR
jgi:prolyl-tRNA synthetase